MGEGVDVDAKIDYFSFTVPFGVGGAGQADVRADVVSQRLWETHPVFASWCEAQKKWQVVGARGHYGEGLFNPKTFTAVRYGGSANHILIEMPGTASAAAREAGVLQDIVAAGADRATRLDIAVDFVDGCSPSEFVAAGYNERFKAHATIVSPEGETEYVGSMKSERYARVYRYAAPHPRSGVLRVEHVLRGDYAKPAARDLGNSSIEALATSCGLSFGWKSSVWDTAQLTSGKLKSSRSDRHEPGKVRWLFNVVLPAIAKAHQEGLIDAESFVADALVLCGLQ